LPTVASSFKAFAESVPAPPAEEDEAPLVSKSRENTPNQRAAEINYRKVLKSLISHFATWSGDGQACLQQVASKVSLCLETRLCLPKNEIIFLFGFDTLFAIMICSGPCEESPGIAILSMPP
jgi:hypothetical protein